MTRTKALMLAGLLATAATSALADGEPRARVARYGHAPIYAPSPSVRSVITPYYFGYYPGHYSYNSPGPVFARLPFYYPPGSCWIWRYNYLYWTC